MTKSGDGQKSSMTRFSLEWTKIAIWRIQERLWVDKGMIQYNVAGIMNPSVREGLKKQGTICYDSWQDEQPKDWNKFLKT